MRAFWGIYRPGPFWGFLRPDMHLGIAYNHVDRLSVSCPSVSHCFPCGAYGLSGTLMQRDR